eukprot:7370568-Pyramimonas_sp.AAC.1
MRKLTLVLRMLNFGCGRSTGPFLLTKTQRRNLRRGSFVVHLCYISMDIKGESRVAAKVFTVHLLQFFLPVCINLAREHTNLEQGLR